MLGRLVHNWAAGTGAAGLALLLLTPVLAIGWDGALTAAWLTWPAYMVHQYEEHDGGRFEAFVNRLFGGGRPVLTPEDILIINVPIVWALTAGGFALAVLVAPFWGLIGLFALLVNGPVHIAQAVAFRQVNPGLWTAVLLFLPIGLWGLIENGDAPLFVHLAALGLSLAVHAGIVVLVLWRRRHAEKGM